MSTEKTIRRRASYRWWMNIILNAGFKKSAAYWALFNKMDDAMVFGSYRLSVTAAEALDLAMRDSYVKDERRAS